MNEENVDALEDVLEQCIEYVGVSNYAERECHALRVARKAFGDFRKGIKPTWFPYKEPT